LRKSAVAATVLGALNVLSPGAAGHAEITGRPAFINLHAAAGSEAEFFEPGAECGHLRLCFGVAVEKRDESANPWDALDLLPTQCARPRQCRAPKQPDDLPSPLSSSLLAEA
jgi:hypothetical protein